MFVVYSFSSEFDISALLSASDEKRRNRYLDSARHTDGELLAYALIKKALSCYGKVYDCERKCKNEYGREFLESNDVFYNIAHSGELCVCVADKKNCGIDCEKMTDKSRNNFIDGCFTENEKEYIESSSDKKYAFYEIWTRKESYLKMTGTGLGGGIRKTDTTEMDILNKTYNFVLDDYAVCCCGDVCAEKPPTLIKLKNNELLCEDK